MRIAMMTVLGSALVSLAVDVPAHAGEVSWERSFDRARDRAIKEDKLIFLDFYATG